MLSALLSAPHPVIGVFGYVTLALHQLQTALVLAFALTKAAAAVSLIK